MERARTSIEIVAGETPMTSVHWRVPVSLSFTNPNYVDVWAVQETSVDVRRTILEL